MFCEQRKFLVLLIFLFRERGRIWGRAYLDSIETVLTWLHVIAVLAKHVSQSSAKPQNKYSVICEWLSGDKYIHTQSVWWRQRYGGWAKNSVANFEMKHCCYSFFVPETFRTSVVITLRNLLPFTIVPILSSIPKELSSCLLAVDLCFWEYFFAFKMPWTF